MEHAAKIEVTLTGESARLYEILSDTAGKAVKPSQINRAVFETGVVHHVLMLLAVGAIPNAEQAGADEAIEEISKHTIMKDLFVHAREYWKNQSGAGMITPQQ